MAFCTASMESARIAFELLGLEVTRQFEPGGVLRFPQFGGQRAAHGPRVFAGRAQAGADARRVGLVAHHEVHDVARRDFLAVFGCVARQQFAVTRSNLIEPTTVLHEAPTPQYS